MAENVFRRSQRSIYITYFCLDMVDNITLLIIDTLRIVFVMDHWRAIQHGLLRVQNSGKNFVLDIDQMEGFFSYLQCFSGNDCHPVTYVSNFII